MSIFSRIPEAAGLEMYHTLDECLEDTYEDKANLLVGAYRDDQGEPWILPVVRKAKQDLVTLGLGYESGPETGLPEFTEKCAEILLGRGSRALAEGRVGGVQALGGNGALFIGAEFIKRHLGATQWYIPNHSWDNHRGIARYLGYDVIEYRYWDAENRKLDFDCMCRDIVAAPPRSVVVIHAVAHNPTGMDLTLEQWSELARIVQAGDLIPLFDAAYLGFASGCPDTDARAVRLFADRGIELFAAVALTKNFGLYNERVGCLIYVTNDVTVMPRVIGQFEEMARVTWSSAPAYGARIVIHVMNNYYHEWLENVRTMARRIGSIRQSLFNELTSLETPGSWEHVSEQIGLFSYTGLRPSQVDYLRTKYHIYLLNNGRISICGLNTNNVRYVALAIDDAVRIVTS